MPSFGIFSVLECPPGRDALEVYAEALDLFCEAERLGFSHGWVAEHHFSDYGTLGGPPVFLAALAARTTTMRVGAAISVLPFHDPLRVAEDYAALDVISGGRLDFGVGRGYQPGEFEGFEIPMSEARDRFLEYLDIITLAWRGGRFDFDGEFRTIKNLVVRPTPVQDPIPTYVASTSPETFDMMADRGYSIMGTLLTNSARSLAPKLSEFRERVPTVAMLPVLMPVYVGDTMADALREPIPELEWYFETVGKLLPNKGEPLDPSYKHFEKVAASTADVDIAKAISAWPIGDAEHVAEFLVDLGRTSTADHFMCFLSVGAMERSKAFDNLHRFAENVMPIVTRELGG